MKSSIILSVVLLAVGSVTGEMGSPSDRMDVHCRPLFNKESTGTINRYFAFADCVDGIVENRFLWKQINNSKLSLLFATMTRALPQFWLEMDEYHKPGEKLDILMEKSCRALPHKYGERATPAERLEVSQKKDAQVTEACKTMEEFDKFSKYTDVLKTALPDTAKLFEAASQNKDLYELLVMEQWCHVFTSCKSYDEQQYNGSSKLGRYESDDDD